MSMASSIKKPQTGGGSSENEMMDQSTTAGMVSDGNCSPMFKNAQSGLGRGHS